MPRLPEYRLSSKWSAHVRLTPFCRVALLGNRRVVRLDGLWGAVAPIHDAWQTA